MVGRAAQLDALTSALEAAELGERVLVLVAGEPGIGKTRLVSEVSARASGKVLWSGCWEGEGAPAFWPWQQLLRAVDAGGQAVPSQANPHPPGRLLDEAPAPDVDPDARFRLFDAVAGTLAEASLARPLVLVLEDLHWADEASILLLEFVARDVRPRRLAVIATYRDTGLADEHPLARHLGTLVREGLHLSLRGLSEADVAEFVRALGWDDGGGRGTAALLHQRSGGNPLFLRELVRLLDDEGRAEGLRTGGSVTTTVVPASVRAVVSRRVDALARSTREVLATAAVMGVDLDAATVGAVTGRADEALLAALDDATEAGIVVTREDGTGFRFAHAVVRDVLYERLGLSARAALHRRFAEVIERRHGEARLPEVAYHVLHGSRADDDVARYALRAGDHSLHRLAYESAADWYARALAARRRAGADPSEQADLLMRCGESRLAAGDLPAARDAYAGAAGIARNTGDAEMLARAALGLGSGFGGFEVQLSDPVQIDLLEEALRALPPQPSRLRAWVLARLSVALSFLADTDRRLALSEQAVRMARDVGDPAALGYALAGHCDAVAGPDGCDVRLAESAEIVRLAREVGDRPLELLGRRLHLVALLETGDVERADREIAAYAHVADELRQPLYRWYVPLWRGMRALMRGDVDAATRHCAEAEQVGRDAHSANAELLTFTQWWVRQRYEGRFSEAGTAMAELLAGEPSGAQVTAGARAVAATQADDYEAAREYLRQWRAGGVHVRAQDSEWLPETAQLAEAAALLGVADVTEALYAQLRPYAHLFCVEGIGAACTGSVAWYLALLARALGREADAEAYAELARVAHLRVGMVGDPPPLAAPAGEPRPSAGTSPVRGTASLVREGVTWAVTYAGTTRRLRDSKGMRDLAVLLSRPGQEVHCLELVGGADVGAEAGPVIDQQARRAYQRRIRELQQDVDEAQDHHDQARAERAEAELDALVQQLSEAFGLSGRARPAGSAAERARSAVSWRIRAATRHAAEAHPEFARHVKNSVRTGTWCAYRPETPVRWEIDRGSATSA